MRAEMYQSEARELHEPTVTQKEREFSRCLYSFRKKLHKNFDIKQLYKNGPKL